MANRKISDLTALTAPVTGDLLPIVDISEAAAADKNKKITYGTFLSSVPLGTAAAPSIAFTGDNTGIYSPGADQVAISTGGTSRLAVSTTAVSSTLAVDVPLGAVGTPSITFTGDLNTGVFSPGADTLALVTGGTNRVHVTSGGLVGIATSSPDASYKATIAGSRSGVAPGIFFSDTDASPNNYALYIDGAKNFVIRDSTNSLNRITVTPAGLVVIGTIASPAYQLEVSTDSAGKPSSALWTIVSDERIKEDIELADLDLCYEAIKAIPLKRYKWRDDIYTAEQVTDRRKLGWIAQDVEAIFPKAVGTHEFKYNQVFEETIIPAVEEVLDDNGNVITPAQPERIEQGDLISEDVIEDCRDLNSDQLYAAMYGAVQKLMAKVETLEASNADMVARLFALEGATG